MSCQDEVGVIGCTDELAYNYNPDAEVDNGGCQYIEGCTDPAALNYNEYAMIMDGSCVYEGEDGEETNTNPNDPCDGMEVLTYDGYDYPLVSVGSQCWFKENLRTKVTNAGVPIIVDSMYVGMNLSDAYGHMAYYNNDSSTIDEKGALYRNGGGTNTYSVPIILPTLCPVGWEPASLDDIETLANESGVNMAAIGHRLKATAPDWNGVDQFGLRFLPTGIASQSYYGSFNDTTTYDQTMLLHNWNANNVLLQGTVRIEGNSFHVSYMPVDWNSSDGSYTVNDHFPIRCIKE